MIVACHLLWLVTVLRVGLALEVLQRAQRISGALQKHIAERRRLFVVGDRGQDSDGLDEHPVQKTELKFFKFWKKGDH